jgi:hypothetical protein
MALSSQSVRRRTSAAERVPVAHQYVTSAEDTGGYPALTAHTVDHQGAVLSEQVGILNSEPAQADQLLHQLDFSATRDQSGAKAVTDLAEDLPGFGHDREGAAGAGRRKRLSVEGVPL